MTQQKVMLFLSVKEAAALDVAISSFYSPDESELNALFPAKEEQRALDRAAKKLRIARHAHEEAKVLRKLNVKRRVALAKKLAKTN